MDFHVDDEQRFRPIGGVLARPPPASRRTRAPRTGTTARIRTTHPAGGDYSA